MNQFTLLVKPTSADCNLRCDYCFYIEKSSLYPHTNTHRMSDEVLDKIISSYMATHQPQYGFAWQGGEPLLMGIDFYRRVTKLQAKYGRSGASVANHLQTNAVLMSDELAEHFFEYNFLVGVSLDGPADIHDRYRKLHNGKGSHEKVARGLNVLRKHQVDTNILTLVTSASIKRGKEIYDYLVDQGILYHQYIPCVEFDQQGKPMPYSLSAELWGEFLCTVFDHWIADRGRNVSVRYFDAILHYLITGNHILCHMERKCNQYFMVEHNGDVYPCDFFAESDLKLGNVCNHSLNQLSTINKYKMFRSNKSNWHVDCGNCKYLYLCSGDCLKHRLNHGTRSPNQKSWLCKGYKMFFDHSLRKFEDIASEIRSKQNIPKFSASNSIATFKVGRNHPCPCGSGSKYKKCCGTKEMPI